MPKAWLKWSLLYLLLIGVYLVFSYSLTAPNLVLSSNPWYWQFQTWMWEHLFNQRDLLTYSYLAIILGLVGSWGGLVYSLWKMPSNAKFRLPQFGVLFLVLSLPLLLANNALSYDVFNYIFNAKMVVFYHANPHVQVALDFAGDDWTRFMHNTHTPAPYGYGWTVFSLLPYLLGFGKFVLIWFNFSLWSWLSLALTLWMVIKIYQLLFKKPIPVWKLALVFLNPLVLIEIIANSHNDLWMMFPALLGCYLLLLPSSKPGKKMAQIITAGFVWAFSVSTKLATLALAPIGLWLLTPLKKFKSWTLVASGLMFLPLLMERSQQFHPWYLTWSLVFLPLIPDQIKLKLPGKSINLAGLWRTWLISLSITSLLRYLPYLWQGDFEGPVLLHQKLITWCGAAILSLAWIIWQQRLSKKD